MQNRESLCFDDLLLVPQFSDIESRKEIEKLMMSSNQVPSLR